MNFPKKVILTYAKSLFQNVKIARERSEEKKVTYDVTNVASFVAKSDEWKFLPTVSIVGEELILVSSAISSSRKLTEFFESDLSNKYDVCMLSFNLKEISLENIPECDLVRKVLNAQTASAYIINGYYLDTLIALYEWSCPLLEQTKEHWNYANDQCWKTLQKTDRWFHFVDRMGKQRSGFSDNSMDFIEYDC